MNYDVVILFDDPVSNTISEVSRNTYRGVTLDQAKSAANESCEEFGCQLDMPTALGATWKYLPTDYPQPVYSRSFYTEYHPGTGDMLDKPAELWVYIGETPLNLG